MPLSSEQLVRLAGLELNAINLTGTLPDIENTRLSSAGTPVYDTNGTLLFHRLPLLRGRSGIGYADIAVQEIFGEPLLAVSTGMAWNEAAFIKEATVAARSKRRALEFDSVRFVAYSFPKIGIQFLAKGKETLMLELKTWQEVPLAAATRRKALEPSNFERWSFIDELPDDVRKTRSTAFKKRLDVWKAPSLTNLDTSVVKKTLFEIPDIVIKLVDTREIHYSPRQSDHSPCYELRGQQTNVWCVAASCEMLLNFYRYQYDQVRLAKELGLGTCSVPNGLPYAQVAKVVTVIEKLTSNALDATMIVNPGWVAFRDEIKANRPLISFVPGHSRTVAGYTETLITLPGKVPFKGLLVYDPWPATDCAHPEDGGVITRWENFATQTYQYAYSAVLKHV